MSNAASGATPTPHEEMPSSPVSIKKEAMKIPGMRADSTSWVLSFSITTACFFDACKMQSLILSHRKCDQISMRLDVFAGLVMDQSALYLLFSTLFLWHHGWEPSHGSGVWAQGTWYFTAFLCRGNGRADSYLQFKAQGGEGDPSVQTPGIL
jgi:hypothetical protein